MKAAKGKFASKYWRTVVSRHAARHRLCAIGNDGFTRMNLWAILISLSLAVAVVLPALAGGQARSEQHMCLANLFHIGRAFQSWGNDHGDQRPWRVPQTQGGTFPDVTGFKPGLTWLEFAWVSNELARADFLVCPSDARTRRVARDFSSDPESGFLNPGFRANALSYFLGLDTYPDTPREVLAGDYNFGVDLNPVGCNARVNNAAGIDTGPPTGKVRWTNAIHGLRGNLLRNDGSVGMMDQARFAEAWRTGDPNDFVHILMPK